MPQGASFDQRDVQFLENKFIAIQADMNAMLAQLQEQFHAITTAESRAIEAG